MQRKASIFRREAMEHHREGPKGRGDVLRIAPTWVHRAYWVLMAALVSLLAFGVLGRVDEFASGPALVRVTELTPLVSPAAGVVAHVRVQPGQKVQAGQALVGLVHAPASPAQVVSQRELTAPFEGVVRDVDARPGQRLEPGQRLLSLTAREAPMTLNVFLPGRFQPLLRPGMALRAELEGFERSYQDLVIASVGDQLIAPGELKRYLGSELEGRGGTAEAVVLVTARLPGPTFQSQGLSFGYVDGMPARAQVRVRSERLFMQLLPGLRGRL
ncbi:HlyD family secretion protein [Myxococcus sp. AB025B]|uniref:HlyD family secretion protein n=1 Tax=Myxococcus sp. AB025B TaxID=2562794 RepID=UPI00189136B5|nr:HlyD family secretion protein [Myxococcus sp. AB025B]